MINEIVKFSAEKLLGPKVLIAQFIFQVCGIPVSKLVVKYDRDAILLVEILEREEILVAGPRTTCSTSTHSALRSIVQLTVQCHQRNAVRIEITDDFIPCVAKLV